MLPGPASPREQAPVSEHLPPFPIFWRVEYTNKWSEDEDLHTYRSEWDEAEWDVAARHGEANARFLELLGNEEFWVQDKTPEKEEDKLKVYGILQGFVRRWSSGIHTLIVLRNVSLEHLKPQFLGKEQFEIGNNLFVPYEPHENQKLEVESGGRTTKLALKVWETDLEEGQQLFAFQVPSQNEACIAKARAPGAEQVKIFKRSLFC